MDTKIKSPRLVISRLCLVFVLTLCLQSGAAWAQPDSPQAPDGGIPILDWSLHQTDPAIAYSTAAGQYLVVWQHQWAVDSYTVINGLLLLGNGTPTGSVIGISQAAKNTSAPSVAYNSTNGQYLVVWEHEYAISDHDIYARIINDSGEPVGDALVVSQDAAFENSPVVAYNPTLNQYLVAWVYHVSLGGGVYIDRIYAQRLDANGILVGSREVIGSSPGNAIAPHLIYNPSSQQYLLVWCGIDAGGDYDIFAQRLLSNSSLVGGVINIATWENHQLYPRAAYNPVRDEFFVVWQDYHWNIGTSQIYGQRLGSAGALIGGYINLPNQSTLGNRLPDVVYQPLAQGYVITWEYVFAAATDMDIYQALLTGTGQVIQSNQVSALASNENRPALASNASSGVQYVWEDSRNLSTSGIDLYGYQQGISLPHFSGHVYEGDLGDLSTPLPGVSVDLHCASTDNEVGAWLNGALTDASGAFSIPVRDWCAYYNLIEEDPQGYLSNGASTPDGVVKFPNWLQFTGLQDHLGNAFFDLAAPPNHIYVPLIIKQ